MAFALVLACVLALGAGVFADGSGAYPSELKYWVDLAAKSPTKQVTIPTSVVVSTDTVIPKDVTISTSAGTVLTLKDDLTINGKLNINGWLYMTPTGRLNPNSAGSLVYPLLDYISTDKAGQPVTYSPYYPWLAQYPTTGNVYILNDDGSKQEYHSYVYYVDGKKYEVEIPWWYYYTDAGTATAIPYYTYSAYTCPIHKTAYIYCKDCSVYYCKYCREHVHATNPHYTLDPSTVVTLPTGSTMTYEDYLKYLYSNYNYNYYNGYYNPWNWKFNNYSDFIAYLNSQYYRDWYARYVYDNYRAKPAVANVKSGIVQPGTQVTLTTETAGGTIYYTLNGTAPDVGSFRYTGPITINKNTKLKTVVIYGNYIASEVMTYTYTVSAAASYTDVAKYDGLSFSLSKLIAAGVIADSDKFEPDAGFTYDELSAMLTACGVDMSKVDIKNADAIKAAGSLTNNDFVYVTYKALRSIDRIQSPQSNGIETIKQLRNYKNITNAAIYRAAFISFIENGLFYELEFDPAAPAARYQLATVLANIVK